MTPSALLDLARARGVLIATAESCTGGLLAAALTDIPGSSEVFERGFITYSNTAKIEMLGVDPETIAQFGAVSEETAAAMADGALARSDADLAVAITGVAGPGASGAKPEGMVCFALARSGHETQSLTEQFGGLGRSRVREKSRDRALGLLGEALIH